MSKEKQKKKKKKKKKWNYKQHNELKKSEIKVLIKNNSCENIFLMFNSLLQGVNPYTKTCVYSYIHKDE